MKTELSSTDRAYLEAASDAVGGTFASDPDRRDSAGEIVFTGEIKDGKPEALVWLRFYYEGGERRVRATSIFPGSHRARPFERRSRSEITVAVGRGSEALARALQRRLLPGHREDLARLREALRRDEERRADTKATAEAIARAAGLDGLPDGSQGDPYEISLTAYRRFGEGSVVRLRCRQDAVSIESLGLHPDVVAAMLRAGRKAAAGLQHDSCHES